MHKNEKETHQFSAFESQKKINHFFSFGHLVPFVNLSLAAFLLYLHIQGNYSLWRLFFLLFAVVERLYETFFTSKENNRDQLEGDWALFFIVISYMLIVYGALFDFYLVNRPQNHILLTMGIIFFLSSLLMRWASILCLRDQWGIHSLEKNRTSGRRHLIRSGPYRFMRHPYYFSVCFEIVSYPLITGAIWLLPIGILIVCPIEIFRGYHEEKYLDRIFGWEYLKYKKERFGYLPIKKMGNYERRRYNHPIPFLDRRIAH